MAIFRREKNINKRFPPETINDTDDEDLPNSEPTTYKN